jgi:hypothetical protein
LSFRSTRVTDAPAWAIIQTATRRRAREIPLAQAATISGMTHLQSLLFCCRTTVFTCPADRKELGVSKGGNAGPVECDALFGSPGQGWNSMTAIGSPGLFS